ncbi:MAG: penicillin-binding protein activator [Betaproteobacteria bacterium]|nr:penicillin-binding protein activator [Betaproteobacteria bacterium]
MQRILAFLLVLFAAFYSSGCASTTRLAEAEEKTFSPPAQSTPAKPVIAATQAKPVEKPLVETSPLVAPPAPKAVETPRSDSLKTSIALLLPLNSASFGPAAEAVRQGAIAAASMRTPAVLPLQVYPTNDRPEDIVSAYRQALQAGAKIVIGPLTRNAVSALARSELITVPTLALNYPEGEISLPENLYLFGLTAEGEARSAARRAFDDGRRTALTVAANTPLAKRMQQAFADAWLEMGGKLAGQAVIPTDQTRYPALRDKVARHPADMIFLAADANLAQMVRPYLDANTPTYATSMVFGGNREIGRNVDLNGVIFSEMPWLLVPDHPAVMVYPRAENFTIEQQRLYALGIDAFRLASVLAQNPQPAEGTVLDGVTGQISLAAHQFTREMTLAQFQEGVAVAVEFVDSNRTGESR